MTDAGQKFLFEHENYEMYTIIPPSFIKNKSDCLFHVKRKTKDHDRPHTSFFSIVFQYSSLFTSNSVHQKTKSGNTSKQQSKKTCVSVSKLAVYSFSKMVTRICLKSTI